MIGVPPYDLDQARFTRFLALSCSGPVDQRALHRTLAKRVATAAGLTFLEAVRSISQFSKRPSSELLEEYLDSEEYKALVADQERIDQDRRRELLKLYGDEDSVLRPSSLERALQKAVKGYPPSGGLPEHFRYDDLSGELKTLFGSVFPVHSTPASAMFELMEWHRVHRNRQAFFCYDTEWWIDGRKRILENIVDTYPARSIYDVQARVRLWQMRSKSGAFLSPDDEASLQMRLLDDLRLFEPRPAPETPKASQPFKERIAEVCLMLKEYPDRSNRAIARRIGVSPQTVANWRTKLREA
ncbi:hypothetical protein [Pararhizobium sp. DWP1-1-3]|uniref:hypothetical protein n=1 Tax=Pararhizobium sp. DWP1-1-3 TaxID=2804652 RepID=UPI003CED19C1